MIRLMISLIITLTTSFALAEDTPFVHLLGYSDNGQYMAFQEAIVADGSGDFVSSIRILDTVTDQYKDYSSSDLQDYAQVDGVANHIPFSDFVARAQGKAQSRLSKYGIKKSNGQQLMVSTAPNISALTYKGKYVSLFKRDLDIEVSPERFAKCASYEGLIPDLGPNKLLGYSIQASDADNYVAGQMLHEDTRIYNSRGCPQAYSINSAVAYGDQVTLMVSVKTFGFEGPDISFITVPFNINDVK